MSGLNLGSYEAASAGKAFCFAPQDEETRKRLMTIDRAALAICNRQIDANFHFPWSLTTITTVFFEKFIEKLSRLLVNGEYGDEAYLPFFDVFDIIVTLKHNEQAEKEGNINVKIDVHQDTCMAPFGKLEMERLKNPEDPYGKIMMEIDRSAVKTLAAKHSIIISEKGVSIFIAGIYIQTMFKILTDEVNSGEAQTVSVNFSDVFEIHAVRRPDENGTMLTSVLMTPGINAKLLIKCDALTEEVD